MFLERKKHKQTNKRFVKDIVQYYDDFRQVFPLNSVRVFPIGPTAEGCEAKMSGLDATIVLDEKFPNEWDDRPIRWNVDQTRECQLECLERMNRHLTGPNRHNSSLKVIDFIQSYPESAESDIVLEAMLAGQKEMEFVFPLNSVRIFPIGPTADGCEAKTSGLDATIVLNEKSPNEWDD